MARARSWSPARCQASATSSRISERSSGYLSASASSSSASFVSAWAMARIVLAVDADRHQRSPARVTPQSSDRGSVSGTDRPAGRVDRLRMAVARTIKLRAKREEKSRSWRINP